MNEIIINKIPATFDEMKSFIDKMEVNTFYRMPKDFKYKYMKIDFDKEYFGKEPYYCWSMDLNYSVTGSVGYVFPLVGNNMVKHFKTLSGAKRSLLKRFEWYYQNLNQ